MSRRISIDGFMTAHLVDALSHLKNVPHDGTLDSYLSGYIVLQRLVEEINQSHQFTDHQQAVFAMIDTEIKRIVKETTETGYNALTQ